MESTLSLQHLPSEVIINCLIFLNIEDLKACRLVSHQLNTFIFDSPKIMRKFKFNLQFSIKSSNLDNSEDLDASVDLNSSSESITDLQIYELKDSFTQNRQFSTLIKDHEELLLLWNFMDSKGHSVRRVNLNLNKLDKVSWNILEQMPNLEELSMSKQLSNIQALPTTVQNIHNLSRLRILTINMNTLKSFINSTKNVTKLEKLTVFISTEDDQDILTNFVAQQKNLKELKLVFDSEMTSINFPSSDITSKVKFQLRKLKIHKDVILNQSSYFNKFIESQAEHLRTFKIDFKPDEQLCEIIIKKCKHLTKLELSSESNDDLFKNINQIWKLPSLTSFKCDVMENPSFISMMTRFPNVSMLKAGRLGLIYGTYDKITEIKAKLMMSHHYDCQFPNLKTLHIGNLLGIKIDDWMKFSQKHKNLEHLTISGTFFCDDTAFGLEHLKNFESLKTLKFRGRDIDCSMLRMVAEMI
ncbi:hypothetical protein ACKWTF_014740 [Chironomus riparius]